MALQERQAYDVVFTDLNMPGMDGCLLAHTLRARGFVQPIIAITAHASAHDRQRCTEAGISEVLVKLILLDSIGRILAQDHPAAPACPPQMPRPPTLPRARCPPPCTRPWTVRSSSH